MSEFQKTMGRLQEMISRSNELVEIKKEAGKIAFQKGLEQGRVEGAITELKKLNELLDLDLDDLMERELAVSEESDLASKDNGLQELELECIEYHKNDLDNIKRIIEKRLKELEGEQK